MARWQLAQLNVAHLLAPLDSPILSDFVANLGRINALAEQSPGFVWKPNPEPSSLELFGPKILTNMSVWEDVATLKEFVFRSAHIEIMSRKREWFERVTEETYVLWWIPAGHFPTLAEAKARLDQLNALGPGPEAFHFRAVFDAPTPD